MKTINHTDFKKKIFKKGKFKQLIISPYASEESLYHKVLLFSDKVEEPTIHTYRRSEMSLILPYTVDIKKSLIDNIELLKSYTKVHATYFGLFDFEGNRILTVWIYKLYLEVLKNGAY